jgi:hypothetical protein
LDQTPLKLPSVGSSTLNKTQSTLSSKPGSNPLQQQQQQPLDPLRFNQENEKKSELNTQAQSEVFFAPWSSRKAGILQKYTTTEQIIIPYPNLFIQIHYSF